MNKGDWVQLGALLLVSVLLIALIYCWIKGPYSLAIVLTIICLAAAFYVTRKMGVFWMNVCW